MSLPQSIHDQYSLLLPGPFSACGTMADLPGGLTLPWIQENIGDGKKRQLLLHTKTKPSMETLLELTRNPSAMACLQRDSLPRNLNFINAAKGALGFPTKNKWDSWGVCNPKRRPAAVHSCSLRKPCFEKVMHGLFGTSWCARRRPSAKQLQRAGSRPVGALTTSAANERQCLMALVAALPRVKGYSGEKREGKGLTKS